MVNRVEGILGARLAVTNDRPLVGGSLKMASVVTSDDRARVRAILLQRMQQEGIGRLKEDLDPLDFPVPESVMVIPLSETYDKFTEEVADQLELSMRVVVRALVVSGKDTNLLALRELEYQVPNRMSLVASTLQFQIGQVEKIEETAVEFPMLARGTAIASIDARALTRGIIGKPLSQAIEYLGQNVMLAEPPTISVSPVWLVRVPILANRVHLTVTKDLE
jgi:hypothetical protein